MQEKLEFPSMHMISKIKLENKVPWDAGSLNIWNQKLLMYIYILTAQLYPTSFNLGKIYSTFAYNNGTLWAPESSREDLNTKRKTAIKSTYIGCGGNSTKGLLSWKTRVRDMPMETQDPYSA